MKDAMPASAIVIVVMLRMPARMTGMASGIAMRLSTWKRVDPMPTAASMRSESTFFKPVCVFFTIGKSA